MAEQSDISANPKRPVYTEAGLDSFLPEELMQIEPKKPYQLTLWVDLEFCTGCNNCTIACKSENNTPVGVDWNRVIFVETGTYPDTKYYSVPMPCMHCGKPPCLASCPVGAISKRASDGIVLIDSDKCIGCRYCIWACPFGAPQYNPERRVSTKCTLCAHRTTDANEDLTGLTPSCVSQCVGRVRFFGDMNSFANTRRTMRAVRVAQGFIGAQPSVLFSGP